MGHSVTRSKRVNVGRVAVRPSHFRGPGLCRVEACAPSHRLVHVDVVWCLCLEFKWPPSLFIRPRTCREYVIQTNFVLLLLGPYLVSLDCDVMLEVQV